MSGRRAGPWHLPAAACDPDGNKMTEGEMFDRSAHVTYRL